MYLFPSNSAFAEAWVLDFAGFGLADCNPKVAVAALQNGVASGTGENCFGGKNLQKSELSWEQMEKSKGKSLDFFNGLDGNPIQLWPYWMRKP